MTIPRIILALTLAAIALPGALKSPAQATVSRPAPATPLAASAPTAVPALVPFTGTAFDAEGKPLQSETQINFQIFKDEEGGDALWMETQQVDVDTTGHYKVQLGAASTNGLPMELFSTGEARWLEIQVAGQKPQPRVLLASVPYALKASDATTLGGLPASAFVLAGEKSTLAAGPPSSNLNPTQTAVTTLGGTTGSIPEFTGADTIGNSNIVQVGSDIGINETTPASTLDVGGTATVRGTLDLPPTNTATATNGYNSQPLELDASAWSSTAAAPVAQSFYFENIATGNNTYGPSGKLDLLFGSGGSAPAATGLSISSNGLINFAPGQPFPGASSITNITTTSPLTGGGNSGNLTFGLSVPTLETTLNAVYPQLSAGNTFHANQTIDGSLTLTNALNTSSIVSSTATITGLTSAEGGINVGGSVQMHQINLATPTTPYNSPYFQFIGSAYNSLTSSSVNQTFAWQTIVTGNDTATPSAYLQLLSGSGTTQSATGLTISHNGVVNFVPSQTFPGTGTIKSITAASPLSALTLNGSTSLTLNTATLESTLNNVYAQLGAANTFTGNQTVNGAENINGSVSSDLLILPATSNPFAGWLSIGGVPFLHAYGAANSDNTFIGGAGNFTTTGSYTTAAGFQALLAQTTGSSNTSIGLNSLIADTTGGQNTAVGAGALYSNVTGSNNTALGADAGAYNIDNLSNTTAIGYDSIVLQDNTVVLGNATSTPGAEFVNVGIGTANPISALEASVSAPGAVGAALTVTNPGGDTASNYGAVAVDFNTQPIQARGYNPGARIEALDDGQNGDSLVFLSNQGGLQNNGLTANMAIQSNGQVNIGATSASDVFYGGQLTVRGGGYAGIVTYGGYGGVVISEASSGISATGANGLPSSGPFGSDGGDGGDFSGGIAGGFAEGGNGITAYSGGGVGISNESLAGQFEGDVNVSGAFSASIKNFKIDHPQDPANKYLIHSSIESNEMVNIYSGNVTTDNLGIAIVHLPDWFEAENGDFRYQLTVMGERFAQAVVSTKIHDHQFTISTNATNVEVSWQVTGVRQDAAQGSSASG